MRIKTISIPVQDPVAAHEIYTTKLGFISKQFDPEAQLAIVVSPEVNGGAELLLEPCVGSFYEDFQKTAFESNLPYMVFVSSDVETEMNRLSEAGVNIRPDLDKPDWGLTNMFEDGCGNLLMLQADD